MRLFVVAPFILIESKWNLKCNRRILLDVAILILIESKWNLKKGKIITFLDGNKY